MKLPIYFACTITSLFLTNMVLAETCAKEKELPLNLDSTVVIKHESESTHQVFNWSLVRPLDGDFASALNFLISTDEEYSNRTAYGKVQRGRILQTSLKSICGFSVGDFIMSPDARLLKVEKTVPAHSMVVASDPTLVDPRSYAFSVHEVEKQRLVQPPSGHALNERVYLSMLQKSGRVQAFIGDQYFAQVKLEGSNQLQVVKLAELDLIKDDNEMTYPKGMNAILVKIKGDLRDRHESPIIFQYETVAKKEIIVLNQITKSLEKINLEESAKDIYTKINTSRDYQVGQKRYDTLEYSFVEIKEIYRSLDGSDVYLSTSTRNQYPLDLADRYLLQKETAVSFESIGVKIRPKKDNVLKMADVNKEFFIAEILSTDGQERKLAWVSREKHDPSDIYSSRRSGLLWNGRFYNNDHLTIMNVDDLGELQMLMEQKLDTISTFCASVFGQRDICVKRYHNNIVKRQLHFLRLKSIYMSLIDEDHKYDVSKISYDDYSYVKNGKYLFINQL